MSTRKMPKDAGDVDVTTTAPTNAMLVPLRKEPRFQWYRDRYLPLPAPNENMMKRGT